MRAEHINITMPVDLKAKIDAESRKEKVGRSTLIQKAVTLYLELVRQKRLKALLAEGYREMALEARAITKEFKHADLEALKYVD